jgi:hypothetical protein
MSRVRDERGAIAGVEGLFFGVLIFVMGTLLVTNAWNVVDSKLATTASAREATRAYVEADNRNSALDAAQAGAMESMAGHGYRGAELSVLEDTRPGYQRCGTVTLGVTTEVDRIALPLISGSGGTITISSTHTEVIDPYRSGLPGTASC